MSTDSNSISQRQRWRTSIQQTFSAFEHRNYRLWFFGQLISLLGSWLQIAAQGFLVFELTGSPAYLGYVGFAAGLPAWLFTLYAGAIADRIPRRRIMVISQLVMMGTAIVLAVLVFTDLILAWHVLILAFLMGTANAFFAPARLAFVKEIAGEEDLTNAIALNAILFNLATVIGPAAGGLIYAQFGPAWCYILNSISFMAVITSLLLMNIAKQPPATQTKAHGSGAKAGLRYSMNEPTIRILLLLVACNGVFALPLFLTLLPVWSVEVLNGDATTNGLLLSARGVGALLSAFLLAFLSHAAIKGRLLTSGLFLLPILLAMFAFVQWLPLSLLILVGVGMAAILIQNVTNALVQALVPDDLRGRVLSIYSLAVFGFIPIGALWIGVLAEYTSATTAVIINAVVLLGIALYIWLFVPKLRALA